jgi:hypothetical protein
MRRFRLAATMNAMGGMDGQWFGAVLLLTTVLVVDIWVVRDARTRQEQGRAVVATVGPVTLSTPEQWLFCCLVLWVFAVPLYVVARSA